MSYASSASSCEQIVAECLEPLGQAPVELLQRVPALDGRGCVDQVGGGFGLEQIELAVQERPAGELAGGRGAGTGGDERRNGVRWDEQPAVGEHFHHVLAGIRAGRRIPGDQRFVDQVAGGGDEAGSPHGARGVGERAQATRRHFAHAGARQPDHRNRGASRWGREGHDRIRQHRSPDPPSLVTTWSCPAVAAAVARSATAAGC